MTVNFGQWKKSRGLAKMGFEPECSSSLPTEITLSLIYFSKIKMDHS